MADTYKNRYSFYIHVFIRNTQGTYQAGDVVDLWRSLHELQHRCEKGVSEEEASEEEAIARETETFDDDATSPIATDDARPPTRAGRDKVREQAEAREQRLREAEEMRKKYERRAWTRAEARQEAMSSSGPSSQPKGDSYVYQYEQPYDSPFWPHTKE